MIKIGRNKLCSCRSGKKYKNCCLATSSATVSSCRKIVSLERHLVSSLLKYATLQFGCQAIEAAWREFSAQIEGAPTTDAKDEFLSVFAPWFVFDWISKERAQGYPKKTIAQHYLSARGGRLKPAVKEFIRQVSCQQFSFYRIEKVRQDKRLHLTDLLVGGDVYVPQIPVLVNILPEMVVYGRVITLFEGSLMVGCAPSILPPWYHCECMELLDELLERVPRVTQATLKAFEFEIRRAYFQFHGEVLRDQSMNGGLNWVMAHEQAGVK